jgi:N-acetylmuramic acid 6-phosphate etherase
VTEGLPPTEGVDERTRGLDLMATAELVDVLISAQRRALDAAGRAAPAIARAADAIAQRLRNGATLHYVGAGTSGRLGFLDAAELPPTFGTPPQLVRGHIAGGLSALTEAVEGAEDETDSVDLDVEKGDALLAISASGTAPYVVRALGLAMERGALGVALTSAPDSPLARRAEIAIVTETGPEPLAGSTRMIAGTAQKVVLGALSTAVMVRLGKVYDNLMVDVVATNEKLRRRAVRLVCRLAGVDDDRARALLSQANGSAKVAIVMQRFNLDAAEARKRLAINDDSLRAVLGH